MDLARLQAEHRVWVEKNFPGQKKWEPLLGLQEEVGELSHVFLKHHQAIRGYDKERFIREAGDAVGDILIYLASFCTANNLDLDRVVSLAWSQVQNRDWVSDPERGGE